MRKYNLNENFFSTWSANMAYILGFLVADGNLFDGANQKYRAYRASINLKTTDRHILESFSKIMEYEGPIYDYIPKNQSQLTINSKTIYQDLFALGLTPRKSLTMGWLENIPEEYMSHYIRGFFDGDGSIFHIKHPSQTRPYIGINFTGTKHYLEGLKKELNKQLKKDYGYIRTLKIKAGEYFQLVYTGDETIKRLLDYIYQDSTESTRLIRKYEIYQNFFTDRIIHPSKENINHTKKSTDQHLITAFGITQSLTDWVNEDFCECSRQQLYHRIVKLNLDPEYAITTKKLPEPEGQNIDNRKVQGNSKINWEIAEEIRLNKLADPTFTAEELAEMYNTTIYTVYDILNNRTWTNPDYTPTTQKSSIIHITHNDITHTIKEWSQITGISYSTIDRRLRQGLPIEQVLEVTETRLKLGKSKSNRDNKAYELAKKYVKIT